MGGPTMWSLAVATVATTGCRVDRVPLDYLAPHAPRYAGSAAIARDARGATGRLRVVSANIRHANDVQRAVAELAVIDALRAADVLLLQEMDLVGTEIIACRLRLNYVYYPATIHPHSGRLFGVAVLSPWPIVRDEKIPLPLLSKHDEAAKAAMVAEVSVGDRIVRLANLHLQTRLAEADYREQLAIVLRRLRADIGAADALVLAGDFNSLSRSHRLATAALTSEAKLVSAITGPTMVPYGVPLPVQLDHVFGSADLEVEAARAVRLRSSDHRALGVDFRFKQPPRPTSGRSVVTPLPGVTCPVPGRKRR
jgi:endonuclease/exonuclease/phosphatase (EEP) superfamily protein YafD